MQEKTKNKHNKKRNTAFLYETLVRELTKAIVSKNGIRKNRIVTILKEHFSKDSVLHRELDVYKSLYETKDVEMDFAQRMLEESRRIYYSLNKNDIFNQQSQVINKINRDLEPAVFSTFLPNYKSLATISQIFDDNMTVKSKVLLEKQVLSMLCEGEVKKEEMRPIDNIVYKQIIKKFNQQYSSSLLEEQKALFTKYILSYADNNIDFVVYLNEEIGRIRNIISESKSVDQESKDALFSKINELKNKPVDKQVIESVLNFQSLVKEMQA